VAKKNIIDTGGGGGVDEAPAVSVDQFVVLTYGAQTAKAVMLDVGTVFTQAEHAFNDAHIADLLEHNVIERVAVKVSKPAKQEMVTKSAVSGGNTSGA